MQCSVGPSATLDREDAAASRAFHAAGSPHQDSTRGHLQDSVRQTATLQTQGQCEGGAGAAGALPGATAGLSSHRGRWPAPGRPLAKDFGFHSETCVVFCVVVNFVIFGIVLYLDFQS